MGTVNLTLANGQLGSTLQTDDGVAGMVLTGASVGSTYTVETPILIKSLDGLAEYDITLSNNAFAYKQVADFYTEAGPGASLYLMLTRAEMSCVDIVEPHNTDGVRKLLDYARGRIKLLGVMTNDTAYALATTLTIDTTNTINADVYDAAQKMDVLAREYFDAQQPFRAVIGGTSYHGSAATLVNLTGGTTNNRTAILVGDTESGDKACIGLLLGRLAVIPVMRKVSRVRTGALSNRAAYLGSATLESVHNDIPEIAGKGYITFITYPNVSGYFFSGDDTCSAFTDDYHFLARGRVIDKVHTLAYSIFVQEVDDEVPVNADGTLDAGFCKWLSQQIENQVNNTMTVNREISSVSCIIDPAQNILSTNQLNVILRIVPVGYATNIEINLGFDNPAL